MSEDQYQCNNSMQEEFLQTLVLYNCSITEPSSKYVFSKSRFLLLHSSFVPSPNNMAMC